MVSWLMLVKDELLKELILLLLRSLEKTEEKKKVSSFRKKGFLPFPTLATAIPQPGGQVALTTQVGADGRGIWFTTSYSSPALIPELPLCPQGSRFLFPHPAPWHRPCPPWKYSHQGHPGLSTARCEGLSSFLSHWHLTWVPSLPFPIILRER